MKISERLNTILNDPSCSHWLKDALRSALRRDIVDSANDAQILAEVLADRCEDLTGQTREMRDWNASKDLWNYDQALVDADAKEAFRNEHDAEILRQEQRRIGPGAE